MSARQRQAKLKTKAEVKIAWLQARILGCKEDIAFYDSQPHPEWYVVQRAAFQHELEAREAELDEYANLYWGVSPVPDDTVVAALARAVTPRMAA